MDFFFVYVCFVEEVILILVSVSSHLGQTGWGFSTPFGHDAETRG